MNEHQSRFKSYLLTPDAVKAEAPLLRAQLEDIFRMHEAQLISPAETALLFILSYLQQRKPNAWMMKSGRTGGDKGFPVAQLPESFDFLRKQPIEFLPQLLVQTRLIKLPEAIFTVLLRWHRGEWKLSLHKEVISSFEMLRLQARGERIATLHSEAALKGDSVDGRRDALEFLLHDLIHAELFFNQPQAHHSQREFFSALLKVVSEGCFEESLKLDSVFARDFDYLISDMNADPHHLAQMLRASCLKHELFRENKRENEQLSAAAQTALRGRLSDLQKRGGFAVSLLGE